MILPSLSLELQKPQWTEMCARSHTARWRHSCDEDLRPQHHTHIFLPQHVLPSPFYSQILRSLWLSVCKPDPFTGTLLAPFGNTNWPASLQHWGSDNNLSGINLMSSLFDLVFIIVQVISIVFSCEPRKQALALCDSQFSVPSTGLKPHCPPDVMAFPLFGG